MFIRKTSVFTSNTFCAIPSNQYLEVTLSNGDVISILNDVKYYLLEKDNSGDQLFAFYNPATRMTHFPREFFNYLVKILHNNHVIVDVLPARRGLQGCAKFSEEYTMSHLAELRDDQAMWINFLAQDDLSLPMRLLDVQTGRGKTVSFLSALIRIGYRSLIVMPPSLISQWEESIAKYTTIPLSKVYIFRGFGSINAANKMLDEGTFNYDIILISIDTISEYILRSGIDGESFPQCFQLVEKMKCGVKGIDETHMNFFANIMVDMNTNVPLNLYLTATPGRTSRRGKYIFDMIFPTFSRFNFDDYDKYIKVREVGYNIPNLGVSEHKFLIPNIGYSQSKYEKHLTKKGYYIDAVVDILIENIFKYLVVPNHESGVKAKCLLYVGTIKFANRVFDRFKSSEFVAKHNLRVCEFFAGHPDDKPKDYDVIFTTFKRSGTGKDIPMVRTILSFASFASDIVLHQLSGRIRKNLSMGPQYAVFLYNTDLSRHLSHKRARKKALAPVVAEIIDA